MQRIIKPTLPVIAFWSVAVFTIGRLADQEILQGAVLVATIPMWFLSVYLMAVMAAPFTLVAREKWGVKTIVFGICNQSDPSKNRHPHKGNKPKG